MGMDLVIESNAKELALRHGALSVKEIVSWADSLIGDLEEPPVELFDVSLAKDLDSLIEALGKFGQSNENENVARLVFKYFYNYLNSKEPNFERVARGLFDMYQQDIAPMSPPVGEMACFWDDLDLAERGYVGSTVQVKKDMLKLLSEHKC
jgi:hypothetical protein